MTYHVYIQNRDEYEQLLGAVKHDDWFNSRHAFDWPIYLEIEDGYINYWSHSVEDMGGTKLSLKEAISLFSNIIAKKSREELVFENNKLLHELAIAVDIIKKAGVVIYASNDITDNVLAKHGLTLEKGRLILKK